MKVAYWLITLNPRSANARSIIDDLAKGGVRAEVFDAVDGRAGEPPLEDGESINTRRAYLFRKKLLTPTQVGCYLSHLRAVKKAYSDGYDRLCIMEDDIAIDDGFFDVLPEILSLDESYELVRLMGLRIRKRKILSGLVGGRFDLVRPVRGVAGTQGYVINRSGMEKLMNTAPNMYEPIDIVYDHSFIHKIRVFGVEPHVIHEIESDSSISRTDKAAPVTPLLYRLLYPFSKLYLSCSRTYYKLKNYKDFMPASYPASSIGRTKRMRR